MMKTLFKTFAIIGLMSAATAVNAQDKLIKLAELPKTAQEFIKKHNATGDISYIKMEDDFFSKKSFEVKLKDGSEFEFDKNGAWKEVDMKHNKAVSSTLVPSAISAYITKSFPQNNIVKISKKSNKYEVELTNGLDLEFDGKGKFIRIDD